MPTKFGLAHKDKDMTMKSNTYQVCSGGFSFEPCTGAQNQNMHVRLLRKDDLGFNGGWESKYTLKIDTGNTRITLDYGAVNEESLKHLIDVFTQCAKVIAETKYPQPRFTNTSTPFGTGGGYNTDVVEVHTEDVSEERLRTREQNTVRFVKQYGRMPTEQDFQDHIFYNEGPIGHRKNHTARCLGESKYAKTRKGKIHKAVSSDGRSLTIENIVSGEPTPDEMNEIIGLLTDK